MRGGVHKPSDVAASLIDKLVNEGERVEDGCFSLDPREARRKLREYQLADPLTYVLMLVEAAHLAGGRQANIEFTLATRTTAEFHGVCLSVAAMRDWFALVFADAKREDRSTRVAQLLALASNAAIAAGARRVDIDNVDATGQRRRLTLEPDAEPSVAEIGAGPIGLTRFEFVGRILGPRRSAGERALLESRTRLSDMGISVNGKHIARGMHSAFSEFTRLSSLSLADELGVIGEAAQTPRQAPATLEILTRGVLTETLYLDELRPGFFAIVDVDLRTDLSRGRIVRDADFEAVLDLVKQAHERLPTPTKQPQLQPEPAEKDSWPLVVAAFTVPFCLWLFSLFTHSATPQARSLTELVESCAHGDNAGCTALSAAMDDPASARGAKSIKDICDDDAARCYAASRRVQGNDHADRLAHLACRAQPGVAATCEARAPASPLDVMRTVVPANQD